jgi:ABC-2 type transport system ATP-binding protein
VSELAFVRLSDLMDLLSHSVLCVCFVIIAFALNLHSMNAVEINSLTKFYGKFKALDGVSLHVPQGEIFGLLGPNGSGKTTLIKCLAGLLKPSGGQVTVLGKKPLSHRSELRKLIGYMPQSPSLYGDISARQNIAFFGRAQNMPDLDGEVDKILEFVELTDRGNDLVRNFSGGMQKRVSLACALIHKPKILFLDEPTAAVDPNLKQRTWQLFKQLASEGVTLFVSTHLMDEALHCGRVAILREGKLLLEDTPENILANGTAKFKMTVDGKQVEATVATNADAIGHVVTTMLKLCGDWKEITSFSLEPESLEDIVLKMINKES